MQRFRLRQGGAICALLAATTIVGADHASAQSFVVQSGQTVGQQEMDDPFDTGLVEAGGTIIDVDEGVDMNNTDQTLTNNGTITSTGDNGVSGGERSRIVNNGTITGDDSGIDSSFDDITIINTGTITGVGREGIAIDGNGTTIVNSGTVTGADKGMELSDVLLIDNSGTIIGTNEDGVAVNGEVTSFTNSGTILGDDSGAVFGDAVETFSNSGSITGTTRDGVYFEEPVTTFTNTGSISGGRDGILGNSFDSFFNSGTITGSRDGVVAGDFDSFTNTGTITGGSSDGVEGQDFGSFVNAGTISGTNGVDGSDFTSFENSGAITGTFTAINANDIGTFSNTGAITSQNAFGLFVDGQATRFFNSGTISGFDNGVFIDDPSNSFVNTGVISSSNSDAILADTIQTFTNAGTLIASAGNDAIQAAGIGTLTLLEGSNLQGFLSIASATTLVTGKGLSVELTFNGGTQTVGSTSGNPFVQAGSNIVVADTTNMSLADDLLAGLTSGISGGVHSRLSALNGGTGTATSAYAASPYLTGYFDSGDAGAGPSQTDPRFWGSSFGTIRHQFDTDDAADANLLQGGLMFGADGWTSGDHRFGVFAGAAFARTDSGAQETKTDSYFGGVYGQWAFAGGKLDALLTAGFSGNDQDRDIANNLVAGGIETASADFDGWFIAPELTYTHPYEIAGRTLKAAATLRYAGLFLDGYTETGVTSPITVANRDVHQATARIQLGMPGAIEHDTGAVTRTLAYAGIEARTQFGDDTVTGSILGQAITFEPGGDDVVGGIFAGGRFEQVWNEDFTLFGGFEVMADTAGLQASAEGGMKVRF